MSRSGYSDDVEPWALICWRGAVASAIRGKRGQGFLREMLAAFDALPQRRLVAWDLEKDGEVCAIGAVGKARGIDMTKLDPECPEQVAAAFNVADALAKEVVYMNDECGDYWGKETPEARYTRMRAWVAAQLVTPQ